MIKLGLKNQQLSFDLLSFFIASCELELTMIIRNLHEALLLKRQETRNVDPDF